MGLCRRAERFVEGKIKHLTNRQQHADIDALMECGKNNTLSYSLAQKWSHEQSSGFYFFEGKEFLAFVDLKKSTSKVAFRTGQYKNKPTSHLTNSFQDQTWNSKFLKKKHLGTASALISGDATTACCISLPPDCAKGKQDGGILGFSARSSLPVVKWRGISVSKKRE